MLTVEVIVAGASVFVSSVDQPADVADTDFVSVSLPERRLNVLLDPLPVERDHARRPPPLRVAKLRARVEMREPVVG